MCTSYYIHYLDAHPWHYYIHLLNKQICSLIYHKKQQLDTSTRTKIRFTWSKITFGMRQWLDKKEPQHPHHGMNLQAQKKLWTKAQGYIYLVKRWNHQCILWLQYETTSVSRVQNRSYNEKLKIPCWQVSFMRCILWL